MVIKHKGGIFFFISSKKYDFMMGDLRTNPYKIAQVIKFSF